MNEPTVCSMKAEYSSSALSLMSVMRCQGSSWGRTYFYLCFICVFWAGSRGLHSRKKLFSAFLPPSVSFHFLRLAPSFYWSMKAVWVSQSFCSLSDYLKLMEASCANRSQIVLSFLFSSLGSAFPLLGVFPSWRLSSGISPVPPLYFYPFHPPFPSISSFLPPSSGVCFQSADGGSDYSGSLWRGGSGGGGGGMEGGGREGDQVSHLQRSPLSASPPSPSSPSDLETEWLSRGGKHAAHPSSSPPPFFQPLLQRSR